MGEDPQRPGRRIRQQRGRETYDALIATAFKLLSRHEFDAITVAELARQAGYSVGAFYARFHSKDELLQALIVRHIEHRRRARERLLSRSTRDDLIRDVIGELVAYYWRRRQFWRAVLIRGMHDRAFWQPIRDHGNEAASALIDRIGVFAGRELTPAERTDVRFALHLALGAINNSIVNRPGPILFLGRTVFIDNLTRAFVLVSNYAAIVAR